MRPECLVRRSSLAPLVVLVAAAAVGGCSAGDRTSTSAATSARDTSGGEAKTGTLTGYVVYVGGPAPGSPRPVAGGAVMFAGTERTTTAMSDHGHFSAELEPGVYVVTATSPDYKSGRAVCEAAHPVRVSAGRTASTHVICQVR